LLISQVTAEIQVRVNQGKSFSELTGLSVNVAEQFSKEGLFFESVDLLYEINKLPNLIKMTNNDN